MQQVGAGLKAIKPRLWESNRELESGRTWPIEDPRLGNWFDSERKRWRCRGCALIVVVASLVSFSEKAKQQPPEPGTPGSTALAEPK